MYYEKKYINKLNELINGILRLYICLDYDEAKIIIDTKILGEDECVIKINKMHTYNNFGIQMQQLKNIIDSDDFNYINGLRNSKLRNNLLDCLIMLLNVHNAKTLDEIKNIITINESFIFSMQNNITYKNIKIFGQDVGLNAVTIITDNKNKVNTDIIISNLTKLQEISQIYKINDYCRSEIKNAANKKWRNDSQPLNDWDWDPRMDYV